MHPNQPKPRAKVSPWLIVALVVVAVLVVCCLVGVIGAALSGDGEQDGGQETGTATSSPAESVPEYRVVTADEDGTIVVEVDAMPAGDGLRQIFDDIRAAQTRESGYWVQINCSSGETDTFDNRLANGRFGIGPLGEAQTGLPEGEAEFEPVDGRSCPA